MRLIDVNAIPPAPWKNGGGATRTIAVSPLGAGFDRFDWRISIADVASSGEFSRFPGVDRTILLLDGAGMILRFDDGRVLLLTEPFEPHPFSGDDGVHSELRDGPSRDFNVMTRRGRAQAALKVVRSESQFAGDAGLFFCARGAATVNDVALTSGWAFPVDQPALKMNLIPRTPDAVIVAVLIKTLGDV